MEYAFISPKEAFMKMDKVRSLVQDLVQSNPVFLSRSGSKETIANFFGSDFAIETEEDAADIRKQPYQLFPLRDTAPHGYRVLIEYGFCNDEPVYPGAPCSNVEFICVWAAAYKVLGFLKIPSIFKSSEQILEERYLPCICLCLFQHTR